MSKDMKENSLLIIGISGVTCGGKTTTASHLKNELPNATLFSQDDYFLDVEDPRHIWIPELNHINFDVITSLDMEKMYNDILQYIKVNNYELSDYMDKAIYSTNGMQNVDVNTVFNKIRGSKLNILIIEGFSIFNYEPMINLFHLKYYFTLDQKECFKRRIQRVYEPADCPGYFEKCVWPEYLNLLNEVKRTVKDVKYLDGDSKNLIDKISMDILHYIQCLHKCQYV